MKAINTIASTIESEISGIEGVVSVLEAAMDPLEAVYTPETWEGRMFVQQNVFTMNLLSVANKLLNGSLQELQGAVDSLYDMSKKSTMAEAQPEKGGPV